MPLIRGLTNGFNLYNRKIYIMRKHYDAFRKKRIYFRFNTINGTITREFDTNAIDKVLIDCGVSHWADTWLIEPDWYPLYDENNEYQGWFQHGLFMPVGSNPSGVGV